MSSEETTSANMMSDGQLWKSLDTSLQRMLPELEPLRLCIEGGDQGADISAMEDGLNKGLELCKELDKLYLSWTELDVRQKKRSDLMEETEKNIKTLGKKRDGLLADTSRLQHQYKSSKETAESLEARIISQEQSLISLSRSVDVVRSENADLEAKIADAKNQEVQLAQRESSLQQRESEVLRREGQVKSAGERIGAAGKELSKRKQQVEAEEQKLLAEKGAFEQTQRNLDNQKTMLVAERKRLDESECAQQMTNSSLNNRSEELDTNANKLLEASMVVASDRIRLSKMETNIQNDANCLDRCMRSLWSLADISDLSDHAVSYQLPAELQRRATSLISIVTEEYQQLRETRSAQNKEINSLRIELENGSHKHAEHKSQMRTNMKSLSVKCEDQQLRITQLQKEKELLLEERDEARCLQENIQLSTSSTIADLDTVRTNLTKTEAIVASQKRKLEELEVKETSTKRRATVLEQEKAKMFSTLESHARVASGGRLFETQLQEAETRANKAEEAYWRIHSELIEGQATHREAMSANSQSATTLAETATKAAQALSKENERLRAIDKRRSELDAECRQGFERLRAKEAAVEKQWAKDRETVATAQRIVQRSEERQREASGRSE